jgi:hypothetical protein
LAESSTSSTLVAAAGESGFFGAFMNPMVFYSLSFVDAEFIGASLKRDERQEIRHSGYELAQISCCDVNMPCIHFVCQVITLYVHDVLMAP